MDLWHRTKGKASSARRLLVPNAQPAESAPDAAGKRRPHNLPHALLSLVMAASLVCGLMPTASALGEEPTPEEETPVIQEETPAPAPEPEPEPTEPTDPAPAPQSQPVIESDENTTEETTIVALNDTPAPEETSEPVALSDDLWGYWEEQSTNPDYLKLIADLRDLDSAGYVAWGLTESAWYGAIWPFLKDMFGAGEDDAASFGANYYGYAYAISADGTCSFIAVGNVPNGMSMSISNAYGWFSRSEFDVATMTMEGSDSYRTAISKLFPTTQTITFRVAEPITSFIPSGAVTTRVGDLCVPNPTRLELHSKFSIGASLDVGSAASMMPGVLLSVSGAPALVDGDCVFADATHTQLVRSMQTSGNVNIPEGVTTVSDYAFGSYEGFANSSLSVPASLNSISYKAFRAPSATTTIFNSISCAAGNTTYMVVDDSTAFATYGSLVEQKFPTRIVIKSAQSTGVADAEGVIYSDDGLTLLDGHGYTGAGTYQVKEGCTAIGENAFGNQNEQTAVARLTSVDLNQVTTVGSNAFRGCAALASVTMPAVEALGNYAFSDTGLTSFTVPSTLVRVGLDVFSGSKIAVVDVSNWHSSTLPSIFSGCAYLKSIDLSVCGPLVAVSLAGCSGLTSVAIPETVTSVSLSGCTSLTSIDLSNTKMTTLSASTFKGCSSLESITLPATMKSMAAFSTGNSPFAGCSSLKSIDLSTMSMTTLPSECFQGCTSLTDIKWPQDLTKIGNYAFGTFNPKGDELPVCSFTSVEIPEGVTVIGAGAFSGCSNLATVTLPATLQRIESGAFNSCTSLSTLELPVGLNYIGGSAFAGTSLTSFKLPAQLFAGIDQATWSRDADTAGQAALFSGSAPGTVGRLLNGITEDKTEWGNVTSLDLSEYQQDYLPPYIFLALDKLTEVEIPWHIASLDSGAFFGCTALKDVYVFNQNIRIAGAGTTGDSSLGWSSETYPTFAHWEYKGTNPDPNLDHAGWQYVSTTGMNLHGLAYASNDLIAYAEKNDCTFVPFVVLDGYDTTSTFGYDVYGYNEVQGVPTELAFTGTDLMDQIAPRIHFTDAGVPDSYDIDLTQDSSRLTYQVTNASGAVVSEVVEPGTYTVRISGVAGSKDVFGTKTIQVSVSSKPASLDVTGSVEGAQADVVMNAVSGSTAAALGNPATAPELKAALDVAQHRVDVSHVSGGPAFDALKAAVGSGTLGMAFDVNYYINDKQVHDGFGRMTVTVTVPDAVNGHWVTLHHRHQDGSITSIPSLRAEDGKVTFTVTDLSTFALEVGAPLVTPQAPAETGGSTGGGNGGSTTTTVYRTEYRPAPAAAIPAALAATGALDETPVPEEAVALTRGPAPDIALGGSFDQDEGVAVEEGFDWLPFVIAGLLVLAAVGALAWFLLANRRRKQEDDAPVSVA